MDDDDNVGWGSSTGSAGSGDGELDNRQGAGYIIGSSTYVADTGNDRIQVFDWKLRYDFQFDASDGDEGTLDAPTDVAIGIDKTVYVADSANDRIMLFNKKGEFQESWGNAGGGDGEFRRPYAIAFSRSNREIYVVDRDNDRVQYFDKSGNYLGQFSAWDGGDHGDGEANDGVYANEFKGAIQAPCRTDSETEQAFCDNGFQVNATAVKDDVRREASTAFSITPAADSDDDGMPDNWEERNGTDPDRDDAAEDVDTDGLPNLWELWFGTDPQRGDSDGGGENDGSEVWGGTDPVDPGDDRVPLLHGIQLRPGDGQVGIVYTPDPAIDTINIYRRRPGSTWETVVTGEPVSPVGVYTDTTPVNGLDYEYRLVPVIPGGFSGAPIGSTTTTPGADTDAPEGSLTINDGAPRTSSKRVTLSLDFDDDALEMRLSNDGAFSDDEWETVVSRKEWELADDVAPGEVAVVYVQYRDAEGNVGFDIYQQDSILYERPTIFLPQVVVE